MPLEALRLELGSNFDKGLSKSEAKKRLETFGLNELSQSRKTSNIQLFLRQFQNPLILILLFAFILSAFLGHKVETVIILLALLINVTIGFFQEKKANNIFEKLSKKLSSKITVIRDGEKVLIDAKELVPGDIIIIETGKKVPADARIIEANNLLVDEAALTGESVPVAKYEHEVEGSILPSNVLFAGTVVVDGFAKAIVIYTGKNTKFGKIAKSLDENQETNTPMQEKIKKISIYLSITMFVIVTVIGVSAYLRGYSLEELAFLLIALAVSSVPEGLPAAIAVALAVGMERILKHKGLVKFPAAAEALGSSDFILTDKTGTLTTGKMQLSELVSASCVKSVCNEKDNLEILKAAVLASDAYVERGTKQVHGRPIEKAILTRGLKESLNQDVLFSSGYSRIDFVNFSSKRRYAISLNADPEFGRRVYFSGAPEALIELADYVYLNGKSVVFSKELKESFLQKQEELSSKGYRMTASAYALSNEIYDEWDRGEKAKGVPVVFLGFMVFEDTIREDVKDAIEEVKQMGVEVLMVTGDHAATAFSIAEKLNIANKKEQVITGEEFSLLKDKDVLKKIQGKDKLRVFARMLPEQKQRLATILQNAGFVIAMTGDGVNDAPALSIANIGIAVESGTDVAKEAADMILLENSFTVISYAVKEGRRLLNNIYKIVTYLLSTAVGETILIGSALLAAGPLPLLPTQLLWHNMIEGGLMNFPFAFEKSDKKRGKLAKNKQELDRKYLWFTALLSFVFSAILIVLYWYLLKIEVSIEELRTVLFVTFSTTGFVLAISLKNVYKPVWKINWFDNKFLNIALSVNIFLLILAFSIPWLREILGIVIPNVFELDIIVAALLVKWFAIEFLKWLIFQRGVK